VHPAIPGEAGRITVLISMPVSIGGGQGSVTVQLRSPLAKRRTRRSAARTAMRGTPSKLVISRALSSWQLHSVESAESLAVANGGQMGHLPKRI
jgi:hypothetical protein